MTRTPLGRLLLALGATAGLCGPARAQVADLVSGDTLRVCADPANSPMSNREETGFENRIADLVAEKRGTPVRYTWFPMVTGFIRQTLQAGRCDVVMGYAQGDDLVLNTNHYYTSTHVLITRDASDLAGAETFSDPRLDGKRIGVVAGSPPATHLARRGMIGLARGYNLVVDRRVENPAAQMLDDLEAGEIDAAILWGPIGGPLVKAREGLTARPLLGETATPRLFYRITMGVRAGELEWKHELNSIIRRNQAEIDRILIDAGVPILDDYGAKLKEPPQAAPRRSAPFTPPT
ncbi:substrate-binding domain-containing protein [Neomegalonema sp.]|uniref:substrate-binding domain-containing protein n=1 Tax=Neomegalonema sp. TaxID=2039713 RepID=UPI00262AD5C2|nr:substrate-binding domain-containing protein [Neomegalonema sp.]MDD2867302.1 substrate-binding domain-containing protein [Neomegalonema sp.]